MNCPNFKVFFIGTFQNTNITMICGQHLTHLLNCTEPQKTHKFNDISEITVDNLKFRPIIAQPRTYTYNAAKIISKYLKPLYNSNEYIINSTLDFPDMIQNQPPLTEDEEYVSYDVESLLTNVPIIDTIDYTSLN